MRWREPVARGALLIMEALWVYALVLLVVSIVGGPDRPSFIGVTLVVVLSYTISRLLQSSDLDLGIIRVWGIVASVLLFYAIVRIDFFGDARLWDFSWADSFVSDVSDTVNGHTSAVFGIPLLWGFWMRGVSRGQDPLMFEAVVSSFATGVVVIVLIELLASAVDAPKAIGYVAVPYIALGLIAIGLAHAARSEADYGRSFSGTWLLAIGGAVAAMSLVALVFVLIDLSTMRDGIAFAGLWLGRGFFLIFYAFTWLVAHAIQAAVDALFWALGMDRENQRPEQFVEGEPESGSDRTTPEPPQWMWIIARVLGGTGVLILAAFGLYLTFSRFIKRRTPPVLKESTYTEGRLGDDLGNFLGAMLGKLRPNFNFGGEPDPVKRLYYDMLSEASHRGVERGAAQTPLELAPALDATFGSRAPAEITNAFDDVRYGGLSKSPEQAKRLRDDWDTVRKS